MARKALLVACSEFRDNAFEGLTYPLTDAERFAAVLRDPELCYFDEVSVLPNATLGEARRAIFSVTGKAGRDDLILLYYSGHGSLDQDGGLSLILPETESDLLAVTSLVADEIKRAFNLSRAAQKVLILDCCYAGAMGPSKMKGSASDSLSAIAQSSSGTFILTASTKFQPAFERNELGGSVLTSCLVDGIAKGEAAPDGDTVTLSALASYAKAQAPTHGAQQPQFWDFGSKGEVVFARRPTTFDEAWRLRVSQALAQYHVDGHIEYDMLEEIRAVIVTPTDETTRPAKELIDRLLKKKIGLARFGSAWTDLREAQAAPPPPTPAEAAPAEATPAPPQPEPPPVLEPEPAVAQQQQQPQALIADVAPPPPEPAAGVAGQPATAAKAEAPGKRSMSQGYLPPIAALAAAAVFTFVSLGSSAEGPILLGLSLFGLALVWLQVRLTSVPGASARRRSAGLVVGVLTVLVYGFFAFMALAEGPRAWSLVFAAVTAAAAWGLVKAVKRTGGPTPKAGVGQPASKA